MKIAISVESTADLTKELIEEFDISVIPFCVILGEQEKLDGVIKPQDIFDYVDKTGKLPHTSAINSFQYEEYFKELLKDHDCVIHFCLSSKISVTCANAISAAEGFGGDVIVIDTLSLSTGISLQAIYARKLANAGKSPKEIEEAVKARIPFDQTSFSLESVNFLYKGGRCSMLSMIGANVLKLKPDILMQEGSMKPGQKRRGPMKKVCVEYAQEMLNLFPNFDPELVFITYSSAPEEVVAAVKEVLLKKGFKRIEETTAGATITTYCGPHCLGILYMNDGPHPVE